MFCNVSLNLFDLNLRINHGFFCKGYSLLKLHSFWDLPATIGDDPTRPRLRAFDGFLQSIQKLWAVGHALQRSGRLLFEANDVRYVLLPDDVFQGVVVEDIQRRYIVSRAKPWQ